MKGEEPRLRVALADDDPLVRRVVRDTLQAAGITVVAEASTFREAVELAIHYRPDILLMDLLMPEGSAVDAIRRLQNAGVHDVRAIILTSFHDDEAAVAALLAGAAGWLTKDMGIGDLPRALRAARDGEAAVSRRFATVLLDKVRQTPEAGIGTRPIRSRLTGREWQVLDLMCAEMDNEDVAEELALSPETVRSHVRSIQRKLDVDSREAAVAAAPRLRTSVS
jgi:DNA-binding NarL/FixJ family response regulator